MIHILDRTSIIQLINTFLDSILPYPMSADKTKHFITYSDGMLHVLNKLQQICES